MCMCVLSQQLASSRPCTVQRRKIVRCLNNAQDCCCQPWFEKKWRYRGCDASNLKDEGALFNQDQHQQHSMPTQNSSHVRHHILRTFACSRQPHAMLLQVMFGAKMVGVRGGCHLGSTAAAQQHGQRAKGLWDLPELVKILICVTNCIQHWLCLDLELYHTFRTCSRPYEPSTLI